MMQREERMERFKDSDLYVVITESFCAGRPAVDVLEACLAAGVTLVQCREKGWEDQDLIAHAKTFREHTAAHQALLMMDDRIDIALAVDADGVHLGQSDMPIAEARQIAPELILGASSHNLEEALEAQAADADYVNIGPIFATQTKDVPTGVVGLEMIDAIAPNLEIPFTCMGGIKLHNVPDVLAQGARHIAVVTAVTAAADVYNAVCDLRKAIHDGRLDW